MGVFPTVFHPSASLKSRFLAPRLFFFILLAACAPAASPLRAPTTLTVYAAASLSEALKAIGAAFEQAHPDTRVVFNFAGSQELRAQIEQGARADVFVSADAKNMDALRAQGLIDGDARILARNRLVVIVPRANARGIKVLGELGDAGVKLVIANPSVPVGAYTLQMLDKLAAHADYGADFKARVLARVVSQENNVRQVVSKVALGEADAGIVYATDAQNAGDKLTVLDIPEQFNVLAAYPLAVVGATPRAALAREFVAWALSARGQAVLAEHGFAPTD